VTTTRRRRIVKWLVAVVLLTAALMAWANIGEPREIQQSIPLRLGMTQSEVEAVMGVSGSWNVERYGGDYRITMLFGRSAKRRYHLYDALRTWTGDILPAWSPPYEDYPVRVRLNRRGGHVDRIERGDEVVDAASGKLAQ
jgi:hypothetical protein